jgi:alpha-glucuronidase
LKQKPASSSLLMKLSKNMSKFSEETHEVIIFDENGEVVMAGVHEQRFLEASCMHKYHGKYYSSYSIGNTQKIGNNPYGPITYKCVIHTPKVGWTSTYYYQADTFGIGFNRTQSGSNVTIRYQETLRSQFNGIKTCPENLLLWFHHVPWNYKMKNDRTLWDDICYHYDEGVQEVRQFQKVWDKVEPYADKQRFTEVQSRLRSQCSNAKIWEDTCLLYFQQFSKHPIPYDIERPVNNLEDIIKNDMKTP